MTYAVRAATADDMAFLRGATGIRLPPDAKGVAAVDAGGATAGCVAYDALGHTSCQAHMAVRSPAVWRRLLRPAFSFPFEQCGMLTLVGMVRESNTRSVDMCEALGFRLAYELKDGWAPGDPLLVYVMRREHCRWLVDALPRYRLSRPSDSSLLEAL